VDWFEIIIVIFVIFINVFVLRKNWIGILEKKESLRQGKQSASFLIEFFQLISWIWASFLSIPCLIRNFICDKQKECYDKQEIVIKEVYVWICLLILGLFCFIRTSVSIGVLSIFLIYRASDICLCSIHDLSVYLDDFSSGFRSLIIALINYFQLAFIFAIIYHLHGIHEKVKSFQISISTMTTLGVGLEIPKEVQASILNWQLLQALIGILFTALIISKFVGISGKKREEWIILPD